MNENNDYNSGNVRPYKASGNLNTAIGNPSININDTMNVNIQNMATNQMQVNNNTSTEGVQNTYTNGNIPQMGVTNIPVNNNINTNTNINVNNNMQQVNNQNNGYVNRTYVGVNNQTKKKNIQLKLGSEFKIALLIMVILMIFIFLLPKISDLFRGY